MFNVNNRAKADTIQHLDLDSTKPTQNSSVKLIEPALNTLARPTRRNSNAAQHVIKENVNSSDSSTRKISEIAKETGLTENSNDSANIHQHDTLRNNQARLNHASSPLNRAESDDRIQIVEEDSENETAISDDNSNIVDNYRSNDYTINKNSKEEKLVKTKHISTEEVENLLKGQVLSLKNIYIAEKNNTVLRAAKNNDDVKDNQGFLTYIFGKKIIAPDGRNLSDDVVIVDSHGKRKSISEFQVFTVSTEDFNILTNHALEAIQKNESTEKPKDELVEIKELVFVEKKNKPTENINAELKEMHNLKMKDEYELKHLRKIKEDENSRLDELAQEKRNKIKRNLNVELKLESKIRNKTL